jgi:hypothetical protein
MEDGEHGVTAEFYFHDGDVDEHSMSNIHTVLIIQSTEAPARSGVCKFYTFE